MSSSSSSAWHVSPQRWSRSRYIVRRRTDGASLMATFFASKSGRRIDVVEQVSIDARRRLVLIRRDDVEHLVMTGGPADVVIETGIQGARGAAARRSPAVAVCTFAAPARAGCRRSLARLDNTADELAQSSR